MANLKRMKRKINFTSEQQDVAIEWIMKICDRDLYKNYVNKPIEWSLSKCFIIKPNLYDWIPTLYALSCFLRENDISLEECVQNPDTPDKVLKLLFEDPESYVRFYKESLNNDLLTERIFFGALKHIIQEKALDENTKKLVEGYEDYLHRRAAEIFRREK